MSWGKIEVIYGCMFSGKSDELVRRLERARYGKYNVVGFKPIIDQRYGDKITTHSKKEFSPTYMIGSTQDMSQIITTEEIIGVDEVQFLDDHFLDFAQDLRANGKTVICAGLLTDYTGRPFNFKKSDKTMLDLIILADNVQMVTAICTYEKCRKEANMTQRLVSGQDQVLVGGAESYIARCPEHHSIPK